jgi:hypothetical protein
VAKLLRPTNRNPATTLRVLELGGISFRFFFFASTACCAVHPFVGLMEASIEPSASVHRFQVFFIAVSWLGSTMLCSNRQIHDDADYRS